MRPLIPKKGETSFYEIKDESHGESRVDRISIYHQDEPQREIQIDYAYNYLENEVDHEFFYITSSKHLTEFILTEYSGAFDVAGEKRTFKSSTSDIPKGYDTRFNHPLDSLYNDPEACRIPTFENSLDRLELMLEELNRQMGQSQEK